MIGLARAAFPAWTAHPDVWLVVGLIAAVYYLAIRRLGPRLAPIDEPIVTPRQVRYFVLALAAIWIASDWPVHELSEQYLYSVHMVQHLLYSMVAAPLLLLATPAWLARYALTRTHTLGLVRTLSRFFPAVLVFNAVFIVIHLPAVVSAGLRAGPVHFSIHVLVLLGGLVVWMPVLSPLPEVPRLEAPLQMFYLFTQSLLPTLPSAMLSMGDHPLYRDYEHFGRLWGISASSDENIAGIIMKTGAGLILWLAIAIVYFRWAATDETFARTGSGVKARLPQQTAPLEVSRDLDRELLGLHRP